MEQLQLSAAVTVTILVKYPLTAGVTHGIHKVQFPVIVGVTPGVQWAAVMCPAESEDLQLTMLTVYDAQISLEQLKPTASVGCLF